MLVLLPWAGVLLQGLLHLKALPLSSLKHLETDFITSSPTKFETQETQECGSFSQPGTLAVPFLVRSLGWDDPLEKNMVAHFSIFAWEIPWAEEPGGL